MTDALSTLTTKDISEIKSYSKPSEGLMMVFNAVCLLQGVA
jgi:hypothetical protein